MEKSEELLDELKQIYVQYQKEVPSKRKPWPESIRGRVSRLQKQGVTSVQIAKQTGIPAHTIYGWAKGQRQKRDAFLPVKLANANQSPIRNQKDRLVTVTKVVTVTIVLPSGIRIEGLSSNLALEMVKKLRL